MIITLSEAARMYEISVNRMYELAKKYDAIVLSSDSRNIYVNTSLIEEL